MVVRAVSPPGGPANGDRLSSLLVQPEFGHVVAGYACTLVLRGLSARLGTFLRHYKDETKPAVTWLSV